MAHQIEVGQVDTELNSKLSWPNSYYNAANPYYNAIMLYYIDNYFIFYLVKSAE